jgi:hypothetical protein
MTSFSDSTKLPSAAVDWLESLVADQIRLNDLTDTCTTIADKAAVDALRATLSSHVAIHTPFVFRSIVTKALSETTRDTLERKLRSSQSAANTTVCVNDTQHDAALCRAITAHDALVHFDKRTRAITSLVQYTYH